ncbi:nucleolar protein 12 [Marchantia polymorpha subsp. ruderalis]|uniref:RRM domain-containing protein n=1 Tax=Marchantia polymorpha subsp. ruderalis TaxID=1480154 RepID=A0A176VK52_MARPO|nr:hypothetical protein AXG93_203s1170 [Marchantia polymorpha subsp. ruderalis]
MGDKAGAAEGSSIFESLFGGFSNGLSIFTNNPFRRKQEAAAAKVEAAAEAEAELKKSGKDGAKQDRSEDASGGRRATPTQSEIESKSPSKQKHLSDSRSKGQGHGEIDLDGGKLHTPKSDDDVSGEKKKKKKRRTEGLGENVEQELFVGNDGSGSSDRRRQKQDIPAGNVEESDKVEAAETDDAEYTLSKKRKKRKGEYDGDAQIEPVKRQSERNKKKRTDEDSAEPQESPSTPDSKIGKAERKSGDSDQVGAVVDEGTGLKGKRPLDLEVVEKRKKKMKLVNEVNELSPRVSDIADAPQKSEEKSHETSAGMKRKKEVELEKNYEKKLRGATDLEDVGGVADMDFADSNSKGKRKVGDDEDNEFMGGKGKKRKLTKQEKVDNDAKLRRTIFVGNVPVNVKAKHLSTEFSQYGAVESARLRSVPIVDVKMPRRAAVITGNLNENRTSLNGYIVFKEEASAQAALAHNMKEFAGKHLRVDLAGSYSSGVEYDRKRSIFIGNLPFDAEDEDLITLFQGNTPELEVEAVRIVRDPQTSAGKGFGFVCFKTKMGAESALDKRDFTLLKNRPLRLERLGSKKAVEKPRAKRDTEERSGLRPKPGAEQRLTKKAPASYEGARAGKRKGVTPKKPERGGSSTANKSGKRAGLGKRPAIAAKKARTLQKKSGVSAGPKVSGGKRKREEKGKKNDSKGKMRKSSKK